MSVIQKERLAAEDHAGSSGQNYLMALWLHIHADIYPRGPNSCSCFSSRFGHFESLMGKKCWFLNSDTKIKLLKRIYAASWVNIWVSDLMQHLQPCLISYVNNLFTVLSWESPLVEWDKKPEEADGGLTGVQGAGLCSLVHCINPAWNRSTLCSLLLIL